MNLGLFLTKKKKRAPRVSHKQYNLSCLTWGRCTQVPLSLVGLGVVPLQGSRRASSVGYSLEEQSYFMTMVCVKCGKFTSHCTIYLHFSPPLMTSEKSHLTVLRWRQHWCSLLHPGPGVRNDEWKVRREAAVYLTKCCRFPDNREERLIKHSPHLPRAKP